MLVMCGPAAHAAIDVFSFERPVHMEHMEGRFLVRLEIRKEIGMRWFLFLFTVRFWVLAWLVILFVGLTPVPPEIELIIVAAFLAHVFWFVCRCIRRAVLASALARAERAEEAEFRRLRRRRPPQGDGVVSTTAGPVTWH